MSRRVDFVGDDAFFSGEDFEITCTVDDGNNPPSIKDLTGSTKVTWVVSATPGSTPLISKTLGSGTTLSDPTNGKFKITGAVADTEALGGLYYHEAKLKDSAGKISTVMYGTFELKVNSVQMT